MALSLITRLNLVNINHRPFFYVLSTYMSYIVTTPTACTLWCHLCTKNVPNWLPVQLITFTNDVHLNPGPTFQDNFFNFMPWNVNSLAKDNFQRVETPFSVMT